MDAGNDGDEEYVGERRGKQGREMRMSRNADQDGSSRASRLPSAFPAVDLVAPFGPEARSCPILLLHVLFLHNFFCSFPLSTTIINTSLQPPYHRSCHASRDHLLFQC
jgi:hypothetical protein